MPLIVNAKLTGSGHNSFGRLSRFEAIDSQTQSLKSLFHRKDMFANLSGIRAMVPQMSSIIPFDIRYLACQTKKE